MPPAAPVLRVALVMERVMTPRAAAAARPAGAERTALRVRRPAPATEAVACVEFATARVAGRGTLVVRIIHLLATFVLLFLGFLARLCLSLLRCGTEYRSNLPSDSTNFPGSRIILNNATWSAAVNTWARRPAAQVWSQCYSSLTDNHDTPAAFHTQCDPHNITVVFARNSLGNVFGGYVRCVLVSFSLHFRRCFFCGFVVDFLPLFVDHFG